MKSDVHTRHCCKHHGCKYDDAHCSVAYGNKEAEYDCEYCEWDKDHAKEALVWLYQYYDHLEKENKLPEEYRNIYNELLALKLRL